jgi:phage terminase large subunit-like protein
MYKKCTQAILSCDLAMKSKDTSSYTVVQIWALRKPNIYLIDQFRDRVEFTKKLLAISTLTDKWNNAQGPGVSAKLVEDKASGPDAIEQLKNRIPGMIPFGQRRENGIHLVVVARWECIPSWRTS